MAYTSGSAISGKHLSSTIRPTACFVYDWRRSLDELADAARRLATDPADWGAAHGRCLRFMDARYGDEQVLGPYIEALEGAAAGVRA